MTKNNNNNNNSKIDKWVENNASSLTELNWGANVPKDIVWSKQCEFWFHS